MIRSSEKTMKAITQYGADTGYVANPVSINAVADAIREAFADTLEPVEEPIAYDYADTAIQAWEDEGGRSW
jgi:hypothetical protein